MQKIIGARPSSVQHTFNFQREQQFSVLILLHIQFLLIREMLYENFDAKTWQVLNHSNIISFHYNFYFQWLQILQILARNHLHLQKYSALHAMKMPPLVMIEWTTITTDTFFGRPCLSSLKSVNRAPRLLYNFSSNSLSKQSQ